MSQDSDNCLGIYDGHGVAGCSSHRGQGEGLPWPEKKANPDWSWRENCSARGLLTQPGPLGADWLPTRPWPPPGCLTGGRLAHPGLHLALRVPVGTDWPRLAHGGGASTSGSESSMNKDPEIRPRVTCPGRRAEGRLRSWGGAWGSVEDRPLPQRDSGAFEWVRCGLTAPVVRGSALGGSAL